MINQVAPYPGDPRYMVTTDGAVWSNRRGRGRWLRPGCMNKFGHVSVALGRGNSRCVHAMVAETFIGPRPHKHDVAHLNGVGGDNRLCNLSYKTRRENNFDMAKHDRHRISRATIANVHELHSEGFTLADIGRLTDMSDVYVGDIIKGKARTRG